MAIATLFASFSSPALTAVFTLGVFLVGRSTDTLAKLPARYFGETVRNAGRAMAHVFPNLQIYVPPRPLLLGQVSDVSLPHFIGTAASYALFYAGTLLVLATALACSASEDFLVRIGASSQRPARASSSLRRYSA